MLLIIYFLAESNDDASDDEPNSPDSADKELDETRNVPPKWKLTKTSVSNLLSATLIQMVNCNFLFFPTKCIYFLEKYSRPKKQDSKPDRARPSKILKLNTSIC